MKTIEFQDKPRTCDPGMCYFCQYKGNGDMVCTNPRVTKDGPALLVVKDWKPTPDHQKCKRLGRKPKSV